ncbi:hypothetical protein Tco_1111534 [Tanacetum coccineum]|uniref:Reverse transcriptase domain-containing protein n=1 Tax=Tanacetum coccineum TaxID=301880 RepID=A0ABQ5ILX2_9ASTR
MVAGRCAGPSPDLNKAMSTNSNPLPEIDWKVESVSSTPQVLLDHTGQVGRNLEVYVDDLVIKSHTEDELVCDIVETFRALRKINMKLNPKKCTLDTEALFPSDTDRTERH